MSTSQGVICRSVGGDFCYVKKPAKDGSLCHNYGDMVLTKETPLNALLNKHGFLNDGLHSYVGYFTHKIALFDSNGTSHGERIDSSNIITEEDAENLAVGKRYTITVTKWTKQARFTGYEAGPFYKWQTHKGFFFLLTQGEVDTLTKQEKKKLLIDTY